jgi:hypothetical protein
MKTDSENSSSNVRRNQNRFICGIICAEMDSSNKAKKNATMMKDCPRTIACGTNDVFSYTIIIIPEDKKWWLEYPQEHPEVLGAKNVKLNLIENLLFPEDFQLRIPKVKNRTAPCGSDCHGCPMRKEWNCEGCPAIIQS